MRVLTAALGAVAILALVITPTAPRWPDGLTPDQVRYQREKARGDDLEAQVEALTAKLSKARPPVPDKAALARAEDLKRQNAEMEAKLRQPGADTHEARADDLRRRLGEATEKLRAPRPNPGDPAAVARAEDLSRQNDQLAADLAKPRPLPDPLANVTATLTREQIAAADDLFGLYTVQAPFDYGEVDLVQSLVGRKANIVGYFQAWTEDFRPDAVKQVWSRGQVPLLTWEPQSQVGAIAADQPEYALPRILEGDFDDYIRRYAQAIAATGLPLIMRFAHEMNGNWYPWSEGINGNGEGDFAKTWRYVYDIFEREGANAYTVWLWSPNRINQITQRPPPKQFYPGDDVVDWIGMSGYYREYDAEAAFAETYGRTLPFLAEAAPEKPIFLSEIGATEAGNRKATWIRSLFAGLDANPSIIGFAWFSLTVTATIDGERLTNDWRINSSAQPVLAMSKGLTDRDMGLPNG